MKQSTFEPVSSIIFFIILTKPIFITITFLYRQVFLICTMVRKVLSQQTATERHDFSGISILAAEMPNKICCMLIERYPGELCHRDTIWNRQQLIINLNNFIS